MKHYLMVDLGTGNTRVALVRSDGEDISALVKDMNKALNGRGGGRNGFAQGSVQCGAKDIEAFFGKE